MMQRLNEAELISMKYTHKAMNRRISIFVHFLCWIIIH